MNQLKESQNDYGKTVDSVANQMRVFNEQTERLSRALGNMFLPILQKVLPYVNAFLMVLTEIVNWLATLFGYNEDDFAGFSSGVGDLTNDFLDLNGSLGNANESAKKLKQGLRGFDKLNVITTPSSGTSGVSAGAGSGIDPRIMDAFNKSMKDYEKRLEKVQMKATKIRDRIMEWLGFTKIVDEETGDVSFKFDHITSGTVLGALAIGGTIFSGVKKILGFFGKIGLVKFPNVKNFTKFATKLKKLKLPNFKGFTTTIKNSTSALKAYKKGIVSLETATSAISPKLGKMVKILGSSSTATTIGTVAGAIGMVVAQLWSYGGVWDKVAEKGSLTEFFKIDGLKDLIQTLFTITGIFQGGLIPFLVIGEEKMSKLNGTTSVLKETFDYCKDKVVDFYNATKTKIEELYEENIKPTIDNIIDLFENDIKPLAEKGIKFLKYGKDLFDELTIKSGLLKSALGVLSGFVGGAFKTAFEYGFNGIRGIVEYVVNFISSKIKGITQVINGVVNVIRGIKNGDWKEVWNGLKDVAVGAFRLMTSPIRTAINSIIGMAETMANAVVSGINVVLKALKKISVKVPDWVPKYGGKEFGFGDIKPMEKVKFGRLKTGIDFVPNDFYGPVYLDYGERVLTKEENQQYSNGSDFANNFATNNKQPINATIVVQVGNEEIARKVINDLEDMASANGKPITIG